MKTKKDKFFKKPRRVVIKCLNPNCDAQKPFIMNVNNIHESEISEILNCPRCGSNNIEIVEVTTPRKQTLVI